MPRKIFIENPIEEARKIEQNISFSDRWEEELKEQLFKDDNDKRVVTFEELVDFAHHPRIGEEWDVPLSEEIKYFDPELSYEITGYRPITMEQGLDFDPVPFRERAITFETTGNYTEFPKGCKAYKDFWDEEYRRCQEGYTIGKYRITGDHYFFLNYYRMQVINEGSSAARGRTDSFPRFLSKQYE